MLFLFVFYNILGFAGIILLGYAVYKSIRTYKKSKVFSKVAVVFAVAAIICLLGQAQVNQHVQNEGVDYNRQQAQNVDFQVYEPSSSINNDQILSTSLGGNTYTVTYEGSTINTLSESPFKAYEQGGGGYTSHIDCYLSDKLINELNKLRQKVITTGYSDGRPSKETVTNPDAPKIKNDCLSIGKTRSGFEVFVDKERYETAGYEAGNGYYNALANINQTFVALNLNSKVDKQDILDYFDSLKAVKPDEIKFIDKNNRLLLINLF